MRGNWLGSHFFTLLKQRSQQEYLCLRIPERLKMGRTDTSLRWSFWIELKTVFKEHKTPKPPPHPLRQGDWPALPCRSQFYSLEHWIRVCRHEVWSREWGTLLKTGRRMEIIALLNNKHVSSLRSQACGCQAYTTLLLPAKQEAPP